MRGDEMDALANEAIERITSQNTGFSDAGVHAPTADEDIISRGVDGSVIVYPNGVPTGTTRYRINDGSQLVKEGTRKTLYKPIAPKGLQLETKNYQ